jgi:PAT family beta-lactamase induction signal transducer AmpG
MLLLPKFLAGFSGTYVDKFGYGNFFIATASLCVPVVILVALASRMHAVRNKAQAAAQAV